MGNFPKETAGNKGAMIKYSVAELFTVVDKPITYTATTAIYYYFKQFEVSCGTWYLCTNIEQNKKGGSSRVFGAEIHLFGLILLVVEF